MNVISRVKETKKQQQQQKGDEKNKRLHRLVGSVQTTSLPTLFFLSRVGGLKD